MRKRKWLICLIVSTVAFTTITCGILLQHEVQHAGAQVAPPDLSTMMTIYRLQFDRQSVTGAQPILPDGARGVTMDQAINAAMTDSPAVGFASGSGHLLPNVQAVAQYGVFTDPGYGPKLASGKVQPILENRPVWIVTFSGLSIPQSGPQPGAAFHREFNVVIDAATGQYVRGFSYR
jgi:hypothetical protein